MIPPGERERKRAVGSFRGLRGGSWNNNENNLRSSNRNNNNPDNENNNIGFRVASPRTAPKGVWPEFREWRHSRDRAVFGDYLLRPVRPGFELNLRADKKSAADRGE